MHCSYVSFHLFAGSGIDDCLTQGVYVHHQFGGLFLRVTEVSHEHVGDVRHQVYRVVPNYADPGFVSELALFDDRFDHFDRGSYQIITDPALLVAPCQPGTASITTCKLLRPLLPGLNAKLN